MVSNAGPCIVCGDTNYAMSMGGPTICPSCDCGNFGPTAMQRQARKIAELTAIITQQAAEIERLDNDSRILASAVLGWTPDLNTQTPEEVAATRDLIEAAAHRAVPGIVPGARVRGAKAMADGPQTTEHPRFADEIERLRAALRDIRMCLRETPLSTIWMTERVNAVLGEEIDNAKS